MRLKKIKITLLVMLSLVTSQLVYGQYGVEKKEDKQGGIDVEHTSFDEGQVDLSLGISPLFVFYNKESSIVAPPLGLAVEYALPGGNFSIGGYLSYFKALSKEKYYPYTEYKHTISAIGIKTAYHFELFNPNLDFYFGLMPFYGQIINTENNREPKLEIYGVSPLVGFRYRFDEQVGIYSELALGVIILQVGINVRIPSEK